jgi:apolipoprotein N-acyltransferase
MRKFRRILKKPFNAAFAAYALFFLATHWWFLDTLQKADKTGHISKYFILVYITLFAGLFAGIAWNVAELAPKSRRWLVFPAAFALSEWVRVNIWDYPGWPLAAIWDNVPVVLQSVSLVGAHGLGFLTLAAAGAAISRRFKAAAAICALVLVYGALRLGIPERMTDFKVRLVNIGYDKGRHYLDTMMRYNMYAHSEGTDDVDLFVFPETAFEADLRFQPEIRNALKGMNNGKSWLVAGFLRGEENPPRVYNSMAVFGVERMLLYDKIKLALFGEYTPVWIPLSMFRSVQTKDMAAGTAARPIWGFGGMKAMPYICIEAAFPGLRVPGDVDFMLIISSDYMFPPSARLRHHNIIVMRAIEEGVAVVRSTSDGVSAIISPLGRVLARGETEGMIEGLVPRRLSRTLFSYTGNWLAMAAMIAVVAWGCRKKKRK